MNKVTDDLISRTVLIDELMAGCMPLDLPGLSGVIGDELTIRNYIDSAPSVDAMPVVHGRWLEERPNTYMRKVKCSVCNGPAPFICKSADYYGRNMHGDFAKTKYCPCCGARMET